MDGPYLLIKNHFASLNPNVYLASIKMIGKAKQDVTGMSKYSKFFSLAFHVEALFVSFHLQLEPFDSGVLFRRRSFRLRQHCFIHNTMESLTQFRQQKTIEGTGNDLQPARSTPDGNVPNRWTSLHSHSVNAIVSGYRLRFAKCSGYSGQRQQEDVTLGR